MLLKKSTRNGSNDESSGDEMEFQQDNVQKMNAQPTKKSGRSNQNRYALQFHKESEKELREMKIDARNSLIKIREEQLEISDDYFREYNFPTRPPWNFEMSKEQLDGNEHRYFTQYIQNLEVRHQRQKKHLSYFELNLETWRQLWRVLELSDIVLVIVDIRYPSLMFPPSLYDYVTKQLGKHMILVLNKIDLSPPSIVLAWKKYFEETYKNINIVMFTSYPSYNLRKVQGNTRGLQIRRRRGKMRMAAEGAQQVFKACQKIVGDAVDMTSWEKKIAEEMQASANGCDNEEDSDTEEEKETEVELILTEEMNHLQQEHVPYQNGILTVGCVGFPNVGKSSLLNALMGRKVVSVSRTPGHTKHFQTIFLTKNVRLCDCPGLVFPSSVPRMIQVLLGSFPIAQLKEPYASIRYLAERLDLPHILNFNHPEKGCDANEWSPIDLCDGWALKRGFLTAKAGRPDTFRASNNILRMALEGKIALTLRPPEYLANKEKWTNHPELQEVITIQAMGTNDKSESNGKIVTDLFISDDDEDDGVVGEDDQNTDEDDEEAMKPSTKNAFALLGGSDSDDDD